MIDSTFQFLSYPLSKETPCFGGTRFVYTNFIKQISKGDSCNESEWTFNVHSSTHIDTPKHFFENGKSITDYSPDFWMTNKNSLLEIKAKNDEIIDLTNFRYQIDCDTEFLLIKTGFSAKRDQMEFWKHGPGISANSAVFLRQYFPKMRFIGFDFISLSSFQNREEGRRAHKAFLNSSTNIIGNPILIIEDMNLEQINDAPSFCLISPLLLAESDGAPVTVFAKLNN